MMKPNEVRRAFEKTELNMSALSQLLQTGRSSVYRWQEEGTDGCNAIVLRLLLTGKITPKDIEAVQ
jgi:hypothetical protein